MQGQCVSLCNPPCGASESCTAMGECVRPPGNTTMPPDVNTRVYVMPSRPADPGWASGAGVTLGLAIGSEATKDEQIPSLPLGVSATVLVAIAGPITAVGAASARDGGDVKGALGLRIVGWVAYGIMLAEASVLIGLGVNEIEPPDGVILSVGALGATSLFSFAGDAFFSAAEANAKRRSGPQQLTLRVAPSLGWIRTHDGTLSPVPGVLGSF
jgi:hypothetical protein